MPRPERQPPGQAGQALETGVHGVGVGARQVDTAKPIDEQGVPGHQVVPDDQALAPRRVARSVEQAHANRTDLDDVVVQVRDERRDGRPAHLRDPWHLVFLDMDRDRGQLEQVGQALDMFPEYFPTHVVGVVVGGEHPGQPQTSLIDPSQQGVYIVSRVDEQNFTGYAVTYDVDVVAHRGGEPVVYGKVFASQQLMEENPVWHAPIVRDGRANQLDQRTIEDASCRCTPPLEGTGCWLEGASVDAVGTPAVVSVLRKGSNGRPAHILVG